MCAGDGVEVADGVKWWCCRLGLDPADGLVVG